MKIKSYKELQHIDESSKWLIYKVWTDKAIGILVAPPKSNKSWFSLEMGIALATCTPFLNHYNVRKEKRVLIYNGEDIESTTRDRIEKTLKARKIDEIPNLGILSSNNRLRIDTREGIESLKKAIIEFKADLLILDPFVRLHSISENDSKAVSEILGLLRQIRDELNCGILLVHHASKDTNNKRAGERIRGSSEFFAWGEIIIALRKDQANQLFMDIEHRAAESLTNIQLNLKVTDGSISLEVHTEKSEEYIQTQDLNKEILNQITSRFVPIKIEQIFSNVNADPNAIRGKIFHLIKNQEIEFTKKGYLRR